jgi:hypothetical protein
MYYAIHSNMNGIIIGIGGRMLVFTGETGKNSEKKAIGSG